MLRLPSADAVHQRLRLLNTGPGQEPTVLVGHLDGRGLIGAGFAELVYLINVDKQAHELTLGELAGRPWVLHPVQAATHAADPRARQARITPADGRVKVPPRTAVVFVVPR